MCGSRVRCFLIVMLTLLLHAVALAWQQDATGWDPVTCWDCDTTPEIIAQFIVGVMITAPTVFLFRRLTGAKPPRTIFN